MIVVELLWILALAKENHKKPRALVYFFFQAGLGSKRGLDGGPGHGGMIAVAPRAKNWSRAP
jgi:hypothetical protein